MSGHISKDNIIVVETRRRWSDDERRQAVDATRHLSVSDVARQFGMAKSLLFRWRKEAGLTRKRGQQIGLNGGLLVEGFVPVQIAPSNSDFLSAPSRKAAPVMQMVPEAGTIEIELVCGIKVRVSGAVKPEALRQVIAALNRDPFGSSVNRDPLGTSATHNPPGNLALR